MVVKQSRSYNSAFREARANATRSRILVAAEELFATKGFAIVTVESISRKAGVSLATVYLYFPGKVAMVASLAEQIVSEQKLSVEHVEQDADPVCQLRLGAQIIRGLNERSWLIADILRSAHGSDESLKSTWSLWQQRHLEAIRRAIVAIEVRGGLREGLGIDEAVDAFYALAGTDVYRALVRERGWSPDHYERWLFRLACIELLGISSVEPHFQV